MLSLCRSRPSQLKPTRYLTLKDGGGIILLRDVAKLLQVRRSVAAKGVLRLGCVVEIDVLIVPTDALGVISNLRDRGVADLVEEPVVLGVFP